jgi:hypothetical protein
MLVLKSPSQLPSLPFKLLVPQQGCTELFGLFLADMLGVVGDAGLTQIIGNGREGALGDLAQRFDHGCHDIFEIGDFGFIQHRRKAQFRIAGIVENGAQMGDVEFAARGIGGLDPRQVGVHVTEFTIDDLDARGFGKGLEGVFPKSLGNRAAPAIEADGLGRPGLPDGVPKGEPISPMDAPARPRYLRK